MHIQDDVRNGEWFLGDALVDSELDILALVVHVVVFSSVDAILVVDELASCK